MPDDELLNDMIARSEDEIELFAVSLKCLASITGDVGAWQALAVCAIECAGFSVCECLK